MAELNFDNHAIEYCYELLDKWEIELEHTEGVCRLFLEGDISQLWTAIMYKETVAERIEY